MTTFRNPAPTVDAVILLPGDRVVLVRRANPPHGWALPGGFVDEGERLDLAAAREAREETGLAVDLLEQFHTYSDPARDPRRHTLATVFLATAAGEPEFRQPEPAEPRRLKAASAEITGGGASRNMWWTR